MTTIAAAVTKIEASKLPLLTVTNNVMFGMIGQDVRTVQQRLQDLGYTIQVDGEFGRQTLATVKRFQTSNGLTADGEIGPKTRAAMNLTINTKIAPPAAPAPTSDASSDKPVAQPAPTDDFSWQAWLRKHLGEAENTGGPVTPFDAEVFSHTTTALKGQMLAGCAATLCAALEETGWKSTHNAMAASFIAYGTAVPLKKGCIIVFRWANGEHHVTTCDEILANGQVKCLGGNQSHMVKDSIYDQKYIAATRWPVK